MTAVRDVSFAVAPGETFGLVGESGSGKSTVLRAIAGLVAPTAGGVRLDGRAMTAKRDRAERRRLQWCSRIPTARCIRARPSIACLREPLEIHGVADRDAAILAALADVGLDPRHRFRYPHQLSGGQRQRVAIARALILSPGLCCSTSRPRRSTSRCRRRSSIFSRACAASARSPRSSSAMTSRWWRIYANASRSCGSARSSRPCQSRRCGEGAATPYGRELIAASRGYVRHGEPLASVRESEG